MRLLAFMAHHDIDEYLDRMTEWAARYGRDAGCGFAEGLRQHLGHGYPHEPRVQAALHGLLRPASGPAR